MRAIGYRTCLPIDDEQALIEIEMPVPQPGTRDLLVAVQAVSVNPLDTKLRQSSSPPPGEVRILGYDAAGVVESVGSEVTLFRPGDEVFYAGAVNRPGSNSELQLVDERIVGRKPRTLSFVQAAALPLCAITAWELLFDRMKIPFGDKSLHGTLLVVNGAGGVGSILTQLARRLTGLTIVATASRPETQAWCRDMGAHHVINHRKPLDQGLKSIGIKHAEYVVGLRASDEHLPAIATLIAPHGSFGLIDAVPMLDVASFRAKAASIHWEAMFTRILYRMPDMIQHHRLLDDVADLVDDGILKTTMASDEGGLSSSGLRRAHAAVESGRAVGKIVLSGFVAA